MELHHHLNDGTLVAAVHRIRAPREGRSCSPGSTFTHSSAADFFNLKNQNCCISDEARGTVWSLAPSFLPSTGQGKYLTRLGLTFLKRNPASYHELS